MVLIQLLLPTKTGSGYAMTPLEQTRRELVEQFSGVTAYLRSPAKGLWTSPEGQIEADDVVMVEVVAPMFDRPWWREVRSHTCQPLRSGGHSRQGPLRRHSRGGHVSKPGPAHQPGLLQVQFLRMGVGVWRGAGLKGPSQDSRALRPDWKAWFGQEGDPRHGTGGRSPHRAHRD